MVKEDFKKKETKQKFPSNAREKNSSSSSAGFG
jgi:hypothetical protein